MDHHARYGSTTYWMVGGGALAAAAFAALIVEATSVPMGQKLTAMLVTLAAWLAGVLVVAASIGLAAVGRTWEHFTSRVDQLEDRHDDLKRSTGARYDTLEKRIDKYGAEMYQLGLMHGQIISGRGPVGVS